jgi:hypothetical protein
MTLAKQNGIGSTSIGHYLFSQAITLPVSACGQPSRAVFNPSRPWRVGFFA